MKNRSRTFYAMMFPITTQINNKNWYNLLLNVMRQFCLFYIYYFNDSIMKSISK